MGAVAAAFRGSDDGRIVHLEVRGVTPGRRARADALPVALNRGAAMLVRFAGSGLVARIAVQTQLGRRGGFQGLDAFALAVLYLCAGAQTSIRAFCGQYAANFEQVAALVGRRKLPSSASFSRTLADIPSDVANAFADAVLAAPEGLDELLKNPAVQHRDANGDGWHVLDFDPSTRAFRQRHLLDDDDHPPALRRAEGVPGHVARKRGEIRQQDHMLQHSGSGLWVWYRLNAEGGTSVPYLAAAAEAAACWIDRLGHPRERTMIRADGEFGHLAALKACTDRQLQFVTRLARYHLFDRPEVATALSNARWRSVRGSEGKQAADLGDVVLHDTNHVHPATSCRVIVTRFRTDRSTPGHGFLREGFQYETFATTTQADAWPAEEIAWLYAGRATIENSFAQQDRAYDIDRTFSYSSCGQQFVVATALLLWNDEICRAAAAHAPRGKITQVLRPIEPPEPADPEIPCVETMVEPVKPTEMPQPPEPSPVGASASPVSVSPRPRTADVFEEVMVGRKLLPDWTAPPGQGILLCPAGKSVHPYHVEVSDGNHGQNRVSLRTAVGACDGCLLRSGCFHSNKQNTYKQLTFGLPPPLAVRLKEAIAAERPPRTGPVPRVRRPNFTPSTDSKPLFTPASPPTAGRYVPLAPSFAVGVARTMAMEALDSVRVKVRVHRGRARPHRTRSLAVHPSVRRAERLSWSELHKRAASRGATVVVLIPAIHRRVMKL